MDEDMCMNTTTCVFYTRIEYTCMNNTHAWRHMYEYDHMCTNNMYDTYVWINICMKIYVFTIRHMYCICKYMSKNMYAGKILPIGKMHIHTGNTYVCSSCICIINTYVLYTYVLYTQTYAFTYIHIFVFNIRHMYCICIYMGKNMYADTCIYLHTQIYAFTCRHMYLPIYTYVLITCVCLCI